MIETFDFWTFAKMVQELGEDLAKDLVERHKHAEAKLPQSQKGKYIRKRLGDI